MISWIKRFVLPAALCAVMVSPVFCAVKKEKASAAQPVIEPVRIYDSTVTWNHFDFHMNEDYSLKSVNNSVITQTTFNVKIIENQYLKVTLLPDFGGRILSIYYKPTGHEELYQNPMGAPYGFYEGNFYYDYLIVYGGIFPTFPEPEHGKTWNKPWAFSIVTNTAEKISIEMRMTDDQPAPRSKSKKFAYGKTGITCIETVSIYQDRSYVEMDIKLINNKPQTVQYEYWTCNTFAPGSVPGDTKCPPNSEIIAPISNVTVKSDWWPWMGGSTGVTFEENKLSLFSKWKDMGIAYASPKIDKDWYGVINHENQEGILRIADNAHKTPGMKFWTWGCQMSYAANISNMNNVRRPYIELWAGNSPQFFQWTNLQPNETKSWEEYYYPTVGLSKVSYANKNGAVRIICQTNTNTQSIDFTAEAVCTLPGRKLTGRLFLIGDATNHLLTTNFAADLSNGQKWVISRKLSQLTNHYSQVGLNIKASDGEPLIDAAVPYK